MKLFKYFVSISAAALAAWSPGLCATFTVVVAPNSLQNSEANALASYPFDGASSMRFQQVYDASQFAAIPSGGGFITGIGFRGDSFCLNTTAQTDANLQINMSTTIKAPDSLSPVFAHNVGPDDRIVRGPSSLDLIVSCSSGRPQFFSALFNLDSPFFYNPASGNLLLDIRNFSGPMFSGTQIVLDGQNTAGDSVSEIVAFNANALTAQQVDSFGFVTEFVIQPVPEPSTWALLLGGGGLLVVTHARRSHKRNNATD